MRNASDMLHALELLPDPTGDAAIRRDWQLLRDAGLPSQLDHTGATNAPHLTLVAAPDVGPAADAAAVVTDLLPVEVRASGLLLLGGRRVTIARAIDVPDALLKAVVELCGLVPELPHQGWLPHLTLARRLDRVDVQKAVDVLGHDDVTLTLTTLRRWNPDRRTAALLL